MDGEVTLDAARRVADTVLYEGYLLYPYRSSAAKNQARWQFGVLVPPRMTERTGDDCFAQTECIVEAANGAVVTVQLRFLQLRTRRDEADAAEWDEADVREVNARIVVGDSGADEQIVAFAVPGYVRRDGGNDYRGEAVTGTLRCSAERILGPYGIAHLRIRVENTSDWFDSRAVRDDAVRRSMVGTHVLLAVAPGRFVSSIDSPEWAKPAVARCENVHTFPVLVGAEPATEVLSAPIILYDYPEIAPESPGDLFDATEIDEILSLRTLALTDEEKAAARATDPRAAAIIDRVDDLAPEVWERLHGAIRSLRAVAPVAHDDEVPWWDPGNDTSVSPETDSVNVRGIEVRRGATVVLRPGARRADAQDMFLAGRVARVEAVLFDVDGEQYVAVTLTDDPAAALHAAHGRFLYFSPDEIEPIERVADVTR